MSYTEEFLGYNWIRRHNSLTIPEHYEIQLIESKDWKHLRNIRNSLHRFLIYVDDPEFHPYIERDLNELTNNEFGHISDYHVTYEKASVKIYRKRFVYRIIKFNDGKLPLVIIDWFGEDQKTITDTHPTANPAELRVGVVMSNGDLFDLLISINDYVWNYKEDYGLNESNDEEEKENV